MPGAERDMVEVVLDHILALAESHCTITADDIEQAEDPAFGSILAGLYGVHEELVYREEQRQRAEREKLELSLPVLRVAEGVILIPLIGTIDAERSEQLMVCALAGISEHRARALVLDITGVSSVDTFVARQLLQIFQALALLGAHAILTGVSPVTAQTLVALGIDFESVRTVSTLSRGIALASSLINAGRA